MDLKNAGLTSNGNENKKEQINSAGFLLPTPNKIIMNSLGWWVAPIIKASDKICKVKQISLLGIESGKLTVISGSKCSQCNKYESPSFQRQLFVFALMYTPLNNKIAG